MEFQTDTGSTERKNIGELTSASNSENSTYETIMGTISGLQQAQSAKTGLDRAIGLGKLGYGVSKAIQFISGALL